MIIEQFLFFTPHITTFYDEAHEIIKEYPRVELLKLSLDEIQPSQFYVDRDKIDAVMKGFETVRAVLAETDDCIFDFVEEAVRRNIRTPKDLLLLSHKEYEEKWNKYCDDYFSAQQ